MTPAPPRILIEGPEASFRGPVPLARSAFTVVEMVVALLVAGLVVAAAYPTVGVLRNAGHRLREEQAAARTAAMVRTTLDVWIRGATTLDGTTPFQGVDRGDDRLPLDELSFGVADAGALRPGPHIVQIRVGRRSGSARGLVAELAPIRHGMLAPFETVELAPQALGLALRFRTTIAGRDQWVDAWSADTVLPRAVELHIVLPATGPASRSVPGGGRTEIMTIPMVIALGWGAVREDR